MLSVKQGRTKYHFWVFGMTQPGCEPWSPEQLANTLLIIVPWRVEDLTKIFSLEHVNRK